MPSVESVFVRAETMRERREEMEKTAEKSGIELRNLRLDVLKKEEAICLARISEKLSISILCSNSRKLGCLIAVQSLIQRLGRDYCVSRVSHAPILITSCSRRSPWRGERCIALLDARV